MSRIAADAAAFIAGVTASATHEIRNVLAIVRESAGLIEDLVRSTPDRASPDRDAVIRALQRIDAQVGRGAGIVAALNRFAHGLEATEGSLDLAEEAAHAVALGRRSAGQRRHGLEVRSGDSVPPIVASPLPVQMALAAAIACTSNQFTTQEFFRAGIPVSLLLVAVLGAFVWLIWPAMGMPVLLR
jgi:signal transduction histidine kinase